MTAEHLCALVADACDLVERGAELEAADDALAAEAAALRDELLSGSACVADPAVADDALAAARELDELVHRVGALPDRLYRLTA